MPGSTTTTDVKVVTVSVFLPRDVIVDGIVRRNVAVIVWLAEQYPAAGL